MRHVVATITTNDINLSVINAYAPVNVNPRPRPQPGRGRGFSGESGQF